MNPATHALIGMTLGRFTKKPLPALLAGIASHAVLDGLPHKDTWHPLWRLIDGGLTGGILVWAMASPVRKAALAGAVGGLLPDIENIRRGKKGSPEPKGIFPSHWLKHEPRAGRYGAQTEMLVAALALCVLWAVAGRRAPARIDRTQVPTPIDVLLPIGQHRSNGE